MNIFISLSPIRPLISFLRTLVSINHQSISYLNGVETSIPIAQWAKTAKEYVKNHIVILYFKPYYLIKRSSIPIMHTSEKTSSA